MNYYDNIADGYDELHGREQRKKIELILQNFPFSNLKTMLDVGCGTGISLEIAERLGLNALGIDPSKKLIEKSKHKCILGKAEELPFKENSFDLVVSLTASQNFDDLEKSIKEMKRVGKYFVISILKRSRKREKFEELMRRYFKIIKTIEEDKDIIIFAEK